MNIGGLQLDVYDRSEKDLLTEDQAALEKGGMLDVELCSSDELDKLANSRFGLVGMTRRGQIVRRFPLHDPSHTKLAAFYFLRNKEKMPPPVAEKVAMRIHAACDEHQVVSPFGDAEVDPSVLHEDPLDLDRAEGHWQPKQASTPSEDDYALVIERRDGEKVGFYYCGDHESLKEAAQTFDLDGWQELEPAVRVKVAEGLRDRLVGEGLFVPEKVASYASTDVNGDLRHWLIAREGLVPSSSRKALTEMWSKRAEFQGHKLGSVLEQFDRMHGLNVYWDGKLADPYKSCYLPSPGETIKVAGTDFSEEQIRELAFNTKKLARIFDTPAIAEFQRNPIEVFRSLPRPTQEVLVGA